MIRKSCVRGSIRVSSCTRSYPTNPGPKWDRFHQQNEKATRQQGGLLFSRENSSNGGKDFRQNSLAQNLMSRKRRVSSKFWEINVFSFNDLQNRSTRARTVSI